MTEKLSKTSNESQEKEIAELQKIYVGMTRGEAIKYIIGLEKISDINSTVVGVRFVPREGVVYDLDNKGGH